MAKDYDWDRRALRRLVAGGGAEDQTNPKDRAGSSKVDLSLFPPVAHAHGAHAMMDGAAKYGAYNWREKRVRALVYISAAQRHLAAYLDGEAVAPDSGVHHLGHAMACCAILLDALETGNLVDDRPVKGAASAVLARLNGAILARSEANAAGAVVTLKSNERPTAKPVKR